MKNNHECFSCEEMEKRIESLTKELALQVKLKDLYVRDLRKYEIPRDYEFSKSSGLFLGEKR